MRACVSQKGIKKNWLLLHFFTQPVITGSIANKVFHEVLLDTCANLASHCWPQDSGKKRKKDGLKSSQADSKRAKPKRKEAAQVGSAFQKL